MCHLSKSVRGMLPGIDSFTAFCTYCLVIWANCWHKNPGGILSYSFLKSMIFVVRKRNSIQSSCMAVTCSFPDISHHISAMYFNALPAKKCKRIADSFCFKYFGYKKAENWWWPWYFCRDFCKFHWNSYGFWTALWTGGYFTDGQNEFHFSLLYSSADWQGFAWGGTCNGMNLEAEHSVWCWHRIMILPGCQWKGPFPGRAKKIGLYVNLWHKQM